MSTSSAKSRYKILTFRTIYWEILFLIICLKFHKEIYWSNSYNLVVVNLVHVPKKAVTSSKVLSSLCIIRKCLLCKIWEVNRMYQKSNICEFNIGIFFTTVDIYKEYGQRWNIARHGKSRKHASIYCRQFLRKLWTCLDKQQFFGSIYTSVATSLQYWSTIDLFLFKDIQCSGKNDNLGNFYRLGNMRFADILKSGKSACRQKSTWS